MRFEVPQVTDALQCPAAQEEMEEEIGTCTQWCYMGLGSVLQAVLWGVGGGTEQRCLEQSRERWQREADFTRRRGKRTCSSFDGPVTISRASFQEQSFQIW